MLFNSPIYIFLFLPVVLLVYFLLNNRRFVLAGKVWLVCASLFFYGYWVPGYLIIIITSIIFNFTLGTALHRSRDPGDTGHSFKRTAVLLSGVIFNIGLLAYYKYADFFTSIINVLVGSQIELLDLVLPLAISFFTFQQIAYLVDSYKADTQEYNFINYCLFVSFFPQLIAGPIVHHREMMPQFMKIRNKLVNWKNMSLGVFFFTIGLFKKCVIADTFAVWANAGFDTDQALHFFDAWGTSLSYTFQLYYDFSGYTDMAIGAALLFNIRLPANFNSPYKAVSVQDFWQRWHMTLSRWLKDYVYIPLGGNRVGGFRVYLNIMVTFLIGGLWHGAGLTFVIWGGIHGLALVVNRKWRQAGMRMSTLSGWIITFLFLNVTWVFFRAETISDALRVLKGMIGMNGIAVSESFTNTVNNIISVPTLYLPTATGDHLLPIFALGYILFFGLISFLAPNTLQISRFLPYKGVLVFRTTLGQSVMLGSIFFASILTFTGDVAPSEFLYFNF